MVSVETLKVTQAAGEMNHPAFEVRQSIRPAKIIKKSHLLKQ